MKYCVYLKNITEKNHERNESRHGRRLGLNYLRSYNDKHITDKVVAKIVLYYSFLPKADLAIGE